MKIQIRNLIIIILFQATFTSGQNPKTDTLFKNDKLLASVLKFIPAGWEIYNNDSSLIIQKMDSIWILEESRLVNKSEDKAVRSKRIVNIGKKTKSRIILKFEKKWDAGKYSEILTQNNKYKELIKGLPVKYNIEKLGASINSGSKYSEIIYAPSNKDEKKRVETYNFEKEQLISKLQKLPDINTENYSLFIKEMTGYNDDGHYVFPDEASIELFTVLNTFKEICEK